MAPIPSSSAFAASTKLIIAHRGACGYLPEHTLEAKALACGMGADYLEQDVVLTNDDRLLVLHDVQLDAVTNVKQIFPSRARENGQFYALDFTWEEIKALRAHERIDRETGKAVFARRFPLRLGQFRLNTLDEEIELIQGLNHSRNREVGLFVGITAPVWHLQQGRDITGRVAEVLKQYGYTKRDDAAIVQSVEADALKQIRKKHACNLPLCQRICGSAEDPMTTAEGLRAIATYADSIGPTVEHLVTGRDKENRIVFTDLVDVAHKHKLKVFPHTLRTDRLPPFVDDFEELLNLVLSRANADGASTDFPDRMAHFLNRH